MNTFGENLKELRTKKGISQTKLGKKVGLSAAHICCMENGKEYPSLASAQRVADFFKVDAKEMLGDTLVERAYTTSARMKRKLQSVKTSALSEKAVEHAEEKIMKESTKKMSDDVRFDLEAEIRDTIGLAIIYADDIKNGRREGSWSELCTDVASTIMARIDKRM